ncbi:MAG: nitroreductase family protein [Syntrophomonadaceae bacterium]|nr:nitroreductase family protein [Syntrophomonadaceae bacterium]MDD3023320.1 nitroreductase family protein [Syntrophomonadaceae bacterium]
METREAVFGRRSIRKYLDKPIEPEVLQYILEGAVMAPSAVNNQPWYFLAVQSQEQMEKLRGIFQEVSVNVKAALEKRFPNNPEVISETLGFLTGLGDAQVCVLVFLIKPSEDYDIIAVQSTSAAIENLCLMAFDRGIGSCWMTAPLTVKYGDVLRREFAPEKGKFIAAVTLGYPAVSPQAPKRKQGRFDII